MKIQPLRIPEERIGALIGPGGEILQEIEERSGANITVDSETGDVLIDDEDAYDPLLILNAQDVIKAIGRGFSPNKAFRLWQDDAYLHLIDLTDHVGPKKNHLNRVKGRIIGEDGRTREHIENMADVHLSVYGKTVGIIGDAAEGDIARDAVEMLVEGRQHNTVYKMLEERRRELRMRDLGLEG